MLPVLVAMLGFRVGPIGATAGQIRRAVILSMPGAPLGALPRGRSGLWHQAAAVVAPAPAA